MRRLRVVHIITELELGGAQQNTLYTVSHLDPARFESHLITGRGGILDEEAAGLHGVSVHFADSLIREVRPLKDGAAYRELKRLLVQIRPDVVHTHSSKAGVLGRMAAHAAGIPVIVHTYHGFGFHRFQNPLVFRFYVAIEKEACRRAHHLVFVSHGNWKWAKELHLIGNCSASLIRSGVKTEPLVTAKRDQAVRAGMGVPENARVVGMIACLKPQKDPKTFVEAADRVTQKLPDVWFVLAGDGELHEQVLERANQMKHPDRFRLLSWRRDVPALLANLDLTVLTSRWEGLPRVIPEATIAGVPVVASDIEGNQEIVIEGKNGTLAKTGDAGDFASRIVMALQDHWTVDPEFSKQVREEFDIDRMVTRQEELYLELAERRGILHFAF